VRYGTIWPRLGHRRGLTASAAAAAACAAGPRRSRRCRSGQPSAEGDLDKAIIRRYIKRNIQKIQYCYEKQLLAKPTLAGTVSAQFFSTPNGNRRAVDRQRPRPPRSRAASPR